jgi:hypothetical protein
MVYLKRKSILILLWLSLILTIAILAYLVSSAVPWRDEEIEDIFNDTLAKAAVCVIVTFSLVFQITVIRCMPDHEDLLPGDLIDY